MFREAIIKAGLRAYKLAQEAKLDRSTVGRYLRGEAGIDLCGESVGRLLKVCRWDWGQGQITDILGRTTFKVYHLSFVETNRQWYWDHWNGSIRGLIREERVRRVKNGRADEDFVVGLAKKTGLRVAILRRYLDGKQDMMGLNVEKICNALDLQVGLLETNMDTLRGMVKKTTKMTVYFCPWQEVLPVGGWPILAFARTIEGNSLREGNRMWFHVGRGRGLRRRPWIPRVGISVIDWRNDAWVEEDQQFSFEM